MARKVLEGNGQGNNRATATATAEKFEGNKQGNKRPENGSVLPSLLPSCDDNTNSVLGVPIDEIRERVGDDWPEVEADPDLLQAVARSIRDRKMREQGIAPPDYTLPGTCRHCGPVWLPSGWPPGPETPICPWCFNRIAGRPVPQPGDWPMTFRPSLGS